MPANRLNFRRIHQEAAVIRRQPHLLALSFLFFFPITFSILSAIPLRSSPIAAPSTPFPKTLIKTPSGELTNFIFVAVFLAAGQVTITYSTHLYIYVKPLSVFSTLKTLIRSFFPVLLNAIVTDLLKPGFIYFIWCLITGDYSSHKYLPSLVLLTIFQSDCRLGAPIIVLEPNQGIFQSSRRGQNLLTNEMLYDSVRSHPYVHPYVLDILSANMVIFGYGLLVALCEFFQSPFISVGVAYLCPVVSFWWAMQLCYYVVSNTLLYVHCKVLRGEDQPEMTASGILEFFQADVGVVLDQNFRNLDD